MYRRVSSIQLSVTLHIYRWLQIECGHEKELLHAFQVCFGFMQKLMSIVGAAVQQDLSNGFDVAGIRDHQRDMSLKYRLLEPNARRDHDDRDNP